MRNPLWLFGFLVLCTTASYAQGTPDARKLADALRGDDKGSAANNPQCKLFTNAEAGRYIGSPVIAISNAGGGSGCSVDRQRRRPR